MRRILALVSTTLLWLGTARADPFWVRWSAADGAFPTETGWICDN